MKGWEECQEEVEKWREQSRRKKAKGKTRKTREESR